MDERPLPAPTPDIDPDSARFWAATLEGRLLIGHCGCCGQAFWYPRPLCPLCGSWGAGTRESTGRGRVLSFTRVYRGVEEYAGLREYVLAYVTLEEGPSMLTNLVDADGVAIGDLVEVTFHRTDGPAALPRFRPVRTRP